jgi:pyridoxamine 5'-phosphate oxidase
MKRRPSARARPHLRATFAHVSRQPEAQAPLGQLADWLEHARAAGEPEHEAMTLATATRDGRPSARIVLCRGIDERGVRFFTNYDSRKGREARDNPHAALVFHWAKLGRQVRLEGTLERLSGKESDAYFQSRPRGHRLQAHASPQSEIIASLDVVSRTMEEVTARFEGQEVPRPPYWGGFLLSPTAIEFWTRGADRVHERIRYERQGPRWAASRLAP